MAAGLSKKNRWYGLAITRRTRGAPQHFCHRPAWSPAMSMIRLRLIGDRDAADSIISVLHGIDGIEHVEEIEDFMLGVRDDSSSANLVDDSEGRVFMLEVDAPDDMRADAVRVVAESEARRLDAGLEFVDGEDF
jgi:hypothetical protein